MERDDAKIILIRRKTRLEELKARYNTVEQARFYVEHMGADFGDYLEEDARYRTALSAVQEAAESLGRIQWVDREFVPNFLFGPRDIIVAIGQDGLVANTMKYLSGQSLLGVNPDPGRWDGVLLPFGLSNVHQALVEVRAGRRRHREVTMAKAVLSDGQTLHAVNDLFIGQRTHVSARYRLTAGGRSEQQSSSGIIVSTGLGATGWLKSVLAGASGIMGALTGSREIPGFQNPDWNAATLYFSVREPFPSRTTGADLTFGRISADHPLTILSNMAEGGVIFSDGIEQDFLSFTSGITATVTLSEKVGQLVI